MILKKCIKRNGEIYILQYSTGAYFSFYGRILFMFYNVRILNGCKADFFVLCVERKEVDSNIPSRNEALNYSNLKVKRFTFDV